MRIRDARRRGLSIDIEIPGRIIVVTAEFLPTASFKIAGRYSLARPLPTLLWEQSRGANLLVPALPTSVVSSESPDEQSQLPVLPYDPGPRWPPWRCARASVRPGIEHDGVKIAGRYTRWTDIGCDRRPTTGTSPPSMISSTLTFPKVCDSRHYCCISFLHRLPEPRCFGRGVSVLIPKFPSRPAPVHIPTRPMLISCRRDRPVTHITSHVLTSTSTQRPPARW